MSDKTKCHEPRRTDELLASIPTAYGALEVCRVFDDPGYDHICVYFNEIHLEMHLNLPLVSEDDEENYPDPCEPILSIYRHGASIAIH